MAQHKDTRTIHTIHIDLEDKMLEDVEDGDMVEVVLMGRWSSTLPKRLSYSDILRLTEEPSRI